MAEILPTVLAVNHDVARVMWSGLSSGDTGAWYALGKIGPAQVSISGTVRTVAVQGSHEDAGANPVTLEDEDGSTLTSAGLFHLGNVPRVMRPVVTDGDGVTVALVI